MTQLGNIRCMSVDAGPLASDPPSAERVHGASHLHGAIGGISRAKPGEALGWFAAARVKVLGESEFGDAVFIHAEVVGAG